ncbi:MAG: aldo/keto reductase [Alphaproteobacteria bacterium]|nr:aldo/keto reductase [Alphaproteobacteria bacterium]
MEYVNLGRTGLKVSRLCLGTMTYGSPNWRPWVLDEEQSRPFFREALDLGINFFDTADVYSLGLSEEILGRAIRHFGVRREDVVIATKVFGPMGDGPNRRGLSRKHIRHAIDASLKRLGTDYVDLYQIHRFDPELPAEEVMAALDDVVRQGKALHIGASSMWAWQFMKCLAVSEREGFARFVSMQNHYNLIYREEEREMIPLCRAEGIGIIPWSPLARGFLAGNRRAGDFGETSRARTDDKAQNIYYQPDDFRVVEALGAVAQGRGLPNMQVALAWVLGRPGVTAPIIGVSKPGQLKELAGALEIRLDAEEERRLSEPYRPHPVAW